MTTPRYAGLVAASVLVGAGSCVLLLWWAGDGPWLFSPWRSPRNMPGGYAIMAVAAAVFTALTAVSAAMKLSWFGRAGAGADERPAAIAASLAFLSFLSTLAWYITFWR